MKVALVSPFIDPESVGEPRWCYDLAQAIAQRIEVVIVTQSPRNRSFKVRDLFPGVEVLEHDPWQLDFLPRRIDAMAKPNYVKFYPRARADLRRLRANGRITCAHHFGPLGLRFPSPLRKLGIPYVFGPLGGSLPLPPGFTLPQGRQPWFVRLRNLDALRWRADPLLRSSYEDAAVLVGVAPYVHQQLTSLRLQRFANRSEVCARVQPDVETAMALRVQRCAGPLRLLNVNRLVPGKGVQYAIDALSRLPRTIDWTLDILGDGPLRGELEAMTRAAGLSERVRFHGHVSRTQVDDFYRQADVFLFPSIQEPSGAVIFEAMGWGLPIIGADYGGPQEHLAGSHAISVGVGSEKDFVSGLGAAVTRLAESPELRAEMGRSALASATRDHSVDAAADFYIDLYGQISQTSKGRG